MNNATDFTNKVQQFLNKTTGASIGSTMKFISADKKSFIWFLFDSSATIQTWITDINEDVDDPKKAISTYGLVATYALDLQREEINQEATAVLQDSLRDKAYETFREMYKNEKEQGFKGCPTSKTWLQNELKKIEHTYSLDMVWHRVYTDNIFHVGCTLSFSDISSAPYNLDLNYNDGIIMISIYQNDTPKTTRNLIVGSFKPYVKSTAHTTFMIANSFIAISDTKQGKYKDSFFLPSVVPGLDDVVADCYGETYTMSYTNEIFAVYYNKSGTKISKDDFSVNGIKYRLQNHLNVIHLHYWSLEGYAIKELTYQKLIAWNFAELHISVCSTKTTKNPNYSSFFEYIKQSYRVWDTIKKVYKTFNTNKRIAIGDTVNSTTNDKSVIFPIIWFIRDEPYVKDDWTAVGESDIINYIDMYNMTSGRIFQTAFDKKIDEFACYSMWMRRMKYTEFNPVLKKVPTDSVTEIWGFGGYVGFAFKIDRKGIST